MESSQVMRCHKSKQDGFCLGKPPSLMIFGMVYGIGVYNILVLRHVAPHFHALRILARLRPSHYRWISLERIPPTDPAFTFKLDPRSRRCPKVWQCPGARWMVHMASARTYHSHGLVWDGNMVKNFINHGKTEVSQF